MFGNKPPQTGADNEMAAAIDTANRNNADNTRILTLLARDYLNDRKSRRRWGWFFKGLIILYLGATLLIWFQGSEQSISGTHTALVELEGLIAPSATNADDINDSLRRAFEASDAVGIIMRINSPGGTPVQAAKINAEIHRLKALYPDKPFYAVVSDVCASGGYYVAVAADQIYAHPSSIVGSIGVRMDAFGFVDAMDKLGIERRLITAGENKGMLDPFSPLAPDQLLHAETMIAEVHQQFIDAVKQGRGDRLDLNEDLFSGLFWTGEKAKTLGLVDDFGGIDEVARDVIGAESIVLYNPELSLLDQFARSVGVTISSSLLESGWSLR
jgi:protease-4